jgi:uncharacterized membrane protein
MNKLKAFIKYLILFVVGGCGYVGIEFLYRQHSHWSMFILGGLCFVIIGAINNIIPWEMPLVEQMLIGSIVITMLEFITGCIVNIGLDLNVWDYSNLPLNIHGQICLPFSLLWFLLSLVCILLDDWLRYWWFGEELPHYKII